MKNLINFIPYSLTLIFIISSCSVDSESVEVIHTSQPSPTISNPTPIPTAIPTETPKPSAKVEPTSKPPDVLFQYTKAVQLLNAAQYKEAITSFDLVLRVLPDLARAYNYRAVAYFNEKQYESALNDLNKSIELKSTFPPAYTNRAAVHIELGKTRLAIDDLEKALELHTKAGNIEGINSVQRIIKRITGQ